MKTYHDAAYAMAGISAATVAFRVLMQKGLIAREEAVRALLDEAVRGRFLRNPSSRSVRSPRPPPN